MARLVARSGQDWAVFFDRRGHQVGMVAGPVAFAHWEPPRLGRGLCGVRCLRFKSDGNLGQELMLCHAWRLDALAVVEVKNGRPVRVTVAVPSVRDHTPFCYQTIGPLAVGEAASLDPTKQIEDAERASDEFPVYKERERALVVAIPDPDHSEWQARDVAQEMVLLASSAGAEVAPPLIVRPRTWDPFCLVGKGQAQGIEAVRREVGANLVILSRELTPGQARNLQTMIGGRVLDRTQLILDIFAQRARTREGKLQVELAQLTYALPRLAGSRPGLDRLGGGIGTRGPGETRLEVDRRRARERISQLQWEIEQVRRTRTLQRQERQSVPYPLVTLVGYTNAGKSTLLNALTGAGVQAEDRLFATLDPTTRIVVLRGSGQRILLSDTVGFIRELPHHLVAAFRATLEEITAADVLLHVIDASSPVMEEQIAAVEAVLGDLGASATLCLRVYNKIDLTPPGENHGNRASGDAVYVSALTGEGLDTLLARLDDMLSQRRRLLEFNLGYEEGWALSWLHEAGKVLDVEYTADGMRVRAELEAVRAARLRRLLEEVKPRGTRGERIQQAWV